MLELTDRNLAWQHLLLTEEVANSKMSVSMLEVCNIEWAKKMTIPIGKTFKMPVLAAAIKSVDTARFDDVCQCELVNKTGAVSCLLHRNLIFCCCSC
jgi:hypothetical protein